MTFSGSVALVTGAGSGIGRATAELLAERGAAVGVLDIDAAAATAAAEAIEGAGGRAHPVVADVSSEASVGAALDETTAALGPPSVLVNCAGILHVAPAVETTAADFDRVLAINLRSVFLTSVDLARRLIAAGSPGSIVNVTSVHAAISEPNASAYTAAKGGIEAMSRTFASEWARHGIRVNCVRPGATRTALTDALYTPEVLHALELRVPLRHPAEPRQIAAAIAYLASSEASYTTGSVLDVDGGYRMDGSLPATEYR